MGRDKNDALELITSLQDSISENLWKLFVYHQTNSHEMNGILQVLNKHVAKLSKFRTPKSGSEQNFGYDELYNKFYVEPFGTDEDIRQCILAGRRQGYPIVYVGNREKLETLVIEFINCILNCDLFIVMENELN